MVKRIAQHYENLSDAKASWETRTGFKYNMVTKLISPVKIFNRNTGRRKRDYLSRPWFVGTKNELGGLRTIED